MSSEKRIAASRANGARSRGPKTPAGKARSSQNAITHGFYTQSVLIPRDDPAAFQQSRQAFLRRFAPSNPAELGLVDAMASAHWRGHRARRLEEEFCAAADRPLVNDPSALRKLDLYSGQELRFSRCRSRALSALLSLRRSRPENSQVENEPKPAFVSNKIAPSNEPTPHPIPHENSLMQNEPKLPRVFNNITPANEPTSNPTSLRDPSRASETPQDPSPAARYHISSQEPSP